MEPKQTAEESKEVNAKDNLIQSIKNIVFNYGYHCYDSNEGCEIVLEMILDCLSKYKICALQEGEEYVS